MARPPHPVWHVKTGSKKAIRCQLLDASLLARICWDRDCTPPGGLPMWALDFLTEWWLDSKSTHPQRAPQKMYYLLWLKSQKSQCPSSLLMATLIKLEETQTRPLNGGRSLPWREEHGGRNMWIPSFLENKICTTNNLILKFIWKKKMYTSQGIYFKKTDINTYY